MVNGKTAASWSISLWPPLRVRRHQTPFLLQNSRPVLILFPGEYKLINSAVAAASCYLTLLALQNTGFRFSFPRTLLADRRNFFLSLTRARISSSLLLSLLLYKGNKNVMNVIGSFISTRDAQRFQSYKKEKRGCMQSENNYSLLLKFIKSCFRPSLG